MALETLKGEIDKPHAKIGQLVVERDFLSKAFSRQGYMIGRMRVRRLSNSMGVEFCLAALEEALARKSDSGLSVVVIFPRKSGRG